MVASEAALFGLPEVKRGLFAAGGGVFVSTRIPLAMALELTLTGDLVDAGRAQSLGLINQVVPPGEVLDAAVALAERIARNGPLALQATKELVRTASTDLEQARALAAEWQPKVFGSEDAKEGRPRSSRSVTRCGRVAERPDLPRPGAPGGSAGARSVGASAAASGWPALRQRAPSTRATTMSLRSRSARREHDVHLVVQDPVAQLVRAYDRDQDDDLVVGVFAP